MLVSTGPSLPARECIDAPFFCNLSLRFVVALSPLQRTVRLRMREAELKLACGLAASPVHSSACRMWRLLTAHRVVLHPPVSILSEVCTSCLSSVVQLYHCVPLAFLSNLVRSGVLGHRSGSPRVLLSSSVCACRICCSSVLLLSPRCDRPFGRCAERTRVRVRVECAVGRVFFFFFFLFAVSSVVAPPRGSATFVECLGVCLLFAYLGGVPRSVQTWRARLHSLGISFGLSRTATPRQSGPKE